MSLGEIPKKAWNWLKPNAINSAKWLHSTPTGTSYLRFAAAGAVAGGVYGLADNLVNDRVSVAGGMIQGAMIGAGIRGVGHAWGQRGKIAGMIRNTNATVSATVAAGAAPAAAAAAATRGRAPSPARVANAAKKARWQQAQANQARNRATAQRNAAMAGGPPIPHAVSFM